MESGAQLSSELYAQVEAYPWDTDTGFQEGLSAIIGPNGSSGEQAAELTLRARCFYYSRKYNVNVDFNEYKLYREQNKLPSPPPPLQPSMSKSLFPPAAPSPTDTNLAAPATGKSQSYEHTPIASSLPQSQAQAQAQPQSQQDAPYPTSFAHIVDLITSGKPVPGIKEIPPTVLEGQGTEATIPRRKKPWEK